MKYRVNLSYPTALEIDGRAYILFPNSEVELPEDAEIIKTYMASGLLTEVNKSESKKEVE